MKNNIQHTCKVMIALTSILFDASQYPSLAACTGISLKTITGSIICGRTLEFAQSLDSHILFIPRNYALRGVGPDGKLNGLAWKSKYAAVGANALHYTEIIDGINEKGLAGGLFYFTDYEYQTVSAQEVSRCIASWQLITWILTTCATIDEVKSRLPHIKIGKAPLPEWGIEVPIHAILHDPTGACIVIEYIKGKLIIYDNPLGVLTNNPSFDWHITNLRNYVNLTAIDVPKIKLSDINIRSSGAGSGMLGIPGDFTPPSRFIRAVAFTQSSTQPQNESQGVDMVFHLLNLFDIPRGSVRTKNNNKLLIEYTQWTSVSDTHVPTYYFHTYNNRQIKKISLAQLNLNRKTTQIVAMESAQKIEDLSPKLK